MRSSQPPITQNNSWGINILVITRFYRSRPPKLHKNILGESFSYFFRGGGGGYSKTSGSPSKPRKKRHLGAAAHDPNARTSMTPGAQKGFRNAPSTAGSSMTGSERPSPKPLLKKEASPAVLGGENSGNALEASNALNYRAWGIPAVLSRGIPGNALRAFPGSFRNYSRISSGKSQPWGRGPSIMQENFGPIFRYLC